MFFYMKFQPPPTRHGSRVATFRCGGPLLGSKNIKMARGIFLRRIMGLNRSPLAWILWPLTLSPVTLQGPWPGQNHWSLYKARDPAKSPEHTSKVLILPIWNQVHFYYFMLEKNHLTTFVLKCMYIYYFFFLEKNVIIRSIISVLSRWVY